MKVKVNLSPYWEDGLTNEEVAKATGLNPNTVSSYRGGRVGNPSVIALLKLRNYFANRTGKKLVLEDLLKIDND